MATPQIALIALPAADVEIVKAALGQVWDAETSRVLRRIEEQVPTPGVERLIYIVRQGGCSTGFHATSPENAYDVALDSGLFVEGAGDITVAVHTR